MANPQQPLFNDLRDDLKGLVAELREMVAARWELARLELLGQRDRLIRLVATCVTAVVMALTALPLLVWCLAAWLDGWLHVPLVGWLLIIAAALLLTAALSSYCAVRRFRRQATGLEETLEELREDAVWFREWIGRTPRHERSEAEPQPPDRLP